MVVKTTLFLQQALRKTDYVFFDVIVTDYHSKDSAGIGLLQQVRKKRRMTPFVFFTREQNRDREEEVKRYGHVAVVPKPKISVSGFDDPEKTIRAIILTTGLGNTVRQKDLFSSMQGGPP
ncbi:response regulator [Methanoregula sp.]|uniref:response regulator n=1 Tax=Methanoregula sp. TaxID=2052170 RepID=UPI002C438D29|nr:response regulator [Methanoregula sp.]HVP96907.1 response regulator [Methanoregula sp.]